MSNKASWFIKNSNGKTEGPFSAEQLHSLATNGTVTADTPISADGKAWRPAVLVPETGLDCLVLTAEEGLNVLGPFAHENLDEPGRVGNIPTNGLLYLRASAIADLPAVRGEMGISLTARVAQAEASLRESERKRARAEADVKARDLEFEAERSRLASEIAALKASNLKKDAELAALTAQADSDKGAAEQSLELQARLVDAEATQTASSRQISKLEAACKELTEQRETLQQRAESFERDLTEARNRLQQHETDARTEQAEAARKLDEALAEAEKLRQALSGLEAQLATCTSERDAARTEAADTRRALEQAAEESAAIEQVLQETQQARESLEASLRQTRADLTAATSAYGWLTKTVQDLAREATRRAPVAASVEDGAQPAATAADAEPVYATDAEGALIPTVVAKEDDPVAEAPLAAPEGSKRRKMAAIENQLQKELSMMARLNKNTASASASAPKRKASREGFIRIFKAN